MFLSLSPHVIMSPHWLVAPLNKPDQGQTSMPFYLTRFSQTTEPGFTAVNADFTVRLGATVRVYPKA